MSEPWHGRPSDSRGYEVFQKPPNPTRNGDYRATPRHGASSAHHRANATTSEWRTIAEHGSPQRPTRGRARRLDANRWHWLLLIPIVIPLVPALYNRMEPTLFGLPFFFWSQLAFAFLASAVITVVHLKVR